MVHNDKVTLIDFGAADTMPNPGEKISTRMDSYKGSPSFSSLAHLKFRKTCARDDLVALFQMMIYLFSDKKFLKKNDFVLDKE